MEKEQAISAALMQWHIHHNKRQMPWKGEKNPYKIWLSEVILQQTRVEQGLDYYEKFIHHFPTVQDLAAANDEVVFKLWEGLGYYNRCKNLLATARIITNQYDGVFPNEYDDIISLKGIGAYTAAAIASFAFNLPFAVVDGNVYRVLSRLFAIDTATDSTAGKQLFAALAQRVLDKEQPAFYNQAIMDFGATVCKPSNPSCAVCFLQQHCAGFHAGLVNKLPVKEKQLQKKHRWFYYFLLVANNEVMVAKRTTKDIWENLFEFWLVEAAHQMEWNKQTATSYLYEQLGINCAEIIHISALQKQQLTHQEIKGQFIKVKLDKKPEALAHQQWVEVNNINSIAFPRFITQYLEMPAVAVQLF